MTESFRIEETIHTARHVTTHRVRDVEKGERLFGKRYCAGQFDPDALRREILAYTDWEVRFGLPRLRDRLDTDGDVLLLFDWVDPVRPAAFEPETWARHLATLRTLEEEVEPSLYAAVARSNLGLSEVGRLHLSVIGIGRHLANQRETSRIDRGEPGLGAWLADELGHPDAVDFDDLAKRFRREREEELLLPVYRHQTSEAWVSRYLDVGRTRQSEGDWEQARRCFATARSMSRGPRPWLALLKLLLRRKELQAAERLAASPPDPPSPEVKVWLARTDLALGRLGTCGERLLPLFEAEAEPRKPILLTTLLYARKTEDRDLEVEALEELVIRRPRDARLLGDLARLCRKLGDPTPFHRAARRYEGAWSDPVALRMAVDRLLERGKASKAWALLRERVDRLTEAPSDALLASLTRVGREFRDGGRRTVIILKELADRFPGNRTLAACGAALLREGWTEEVRKLAEENPDHPDLALLATEALVEEEAFGEALSRLPTLPERPTTWALRLRCLHGLDRQEDLNHLCDRLRNDPKTPHNVQLLAAALSGEEVEPPKRTEAAPTVPTPRPQKAEREPRKAPPVSSPSGQKPEEPVLREPILWIGVLGPVRTEWRLRPGRKAIIGRDPDCDFVLPHDDTVSRKHVALTFHGDDVTLESLEPTNPPLLRGSPFERQTLPTTAPIPLRLGETELRLVQLNQ